jgi:hypothetical protein
MVAPAYQRDQASTPFSPRFEMLSFVSSQKRLKLFYLPNYSPEFTYSNSRLYFLDILPVKEC